MRARKYRTQVIKERHQQRHVGSKAKTEPERDGEATGEEGHGIGECNKGLPVLTLTRSPG